MDTLRTSRSPDPRRSASGHALRALRLLPRGALFAALLVSAAPGGAETTSVNGQIAYVVVGPSSDPFIPLQSDIWVMEADGSGSVNLTNTPDVDETDPAWSPDGTRIAYIEGSTRLAVMNQDGGGREILTPEPSYQFGPTWSPGGTQIALVRQVPGEVMTIQFDIVVVAVDGSGETNITNSDFDELEPAWSPDGDRIAFAGVRFEMATDPIDGLPVESAGWEIVTVAPDGSDERILSAGDPETPRSRGLEEDRAPSWSPDGSMLVFMSQIVDPCCDHWKIVAVRRDGGGVSVLSNDPEVYDMAPSWSPDGTQIVFASDRDAASGGDFDLYRMPAPTELPIPDGAAQAKATDRSVRLTTNGQATRPHWGGRRPLPGTLSLFVVKSKERGARGRVSVSPRGTRAGSRRSRHSTFAAGTQVELTATPRRRSSFAGWSGASDATGSPYVLTMDDVKLITARFVKTR